MMLAMVAEDRKNSEIGQRVMRLRGERSQKSVADDMRLRGWKWSQATMWSIESGDRPLRLTEATDLAAVLGVDLMDFFKDPEVLGIEVEIRQRMSDAMSLYMDAVRGLRNLRFTQDSLQNRISDLSLKNDDRFTRVLELAQDAAARFTVAAAVEEAESPDDSRGGLGRGHGILLPGDIRDGLD